MICAARLGEFPYFFGDAMHVNRKADTAVANKGNSKFFLSHFTTVTVKSLDGNCVPLMFSLKKLHGEGKKTICLRSMRRSCTQVARAMSGLFRVEHAD